MGGMGGMGGLNSMYSSLNSPFGMQNMYYSIDTGTVLNYQVPFLQIAPYLGMAGLYSNLFPSLYGSSSIYGRAAQQVISALYNALVADSVLGPALLANPVILDILASDAALAAIGAANPLWLIFHTWQATADPLLLSTIAVSCTQCHSNVNSGALLAGYPLPAQLI